MADGQPEHTADGDRSDAGPGDRSDTGHGDREEHRGEMGRAVVVGAVGGFVAAIPMGILLQLGTGVLPVLGGLLGAPSLLGGWVMNFVIGTLHGVVFAVVLAWPAVHRMVPLDGFAEDVLAGLVYGTLVAMFTIAALPFTLEVLEGGGPSNPGMVGLGASVVLAVGNLIFGAVLGAAYATLQGSGPSD